MWSFFPTLEMNTTLAFQAWKDSCEAAGATIPEFCWDVPLHKRILDLVMSGVKENVCYYISYHLKKGCILYSAFLPL